MAEQPLNGSAAALAVAGYPESGPADADDAVADERDMLDGAWLSLAPISVGSEDAVQDERRHVQRRLPGLAAPWQSVEEEWPHCGYPSSTCKALFGKALANSHPGPKLHYQGHVAYIVHMSDIVPIDGGLGDDVIEGEDVAIRPAGPPPGSECMTNASGHCGVVAQCLRAREDQLGMPVAVPGASLSPARSLSPPRTSRPPTEPEASSLLIPPSQWGSSEALPGSAAAADRADGVRA